MPNWPCSPPGGAPGIGFNGIGSNYANEDYHNNHPCLYQDDLSTFLPPDVEDFLADVRSYPPGYNGLVKHCRSFKSIVNVGTEKVKPYGSA